MIKYLFFLLLTIVLSNSIANASPKKDKLQELLRIAELNNPQVKAAKETYQSASLKASGVGYFPDPMIKFNYFGSPIETKNGPQKSNLVISQEIPWPQTLDSLESMAQKIAEIEKEKGNLLQLEVSFAIKSLVYKNILLDKKIKNKMRILLSLEKLIEVVVARLKVGQSSQTDVSRINIEIAKLKQEIRQLESDILNIKHELKKTIGNESAILDLPDDFAQSWLTLPTGFDSHAQNFQSHPMVSINQRKIEKFDARAALERSKSYPMIGVSATWFQIDKPEGMSTENSGKDAWAIGASISIPIWSSKYEALEKSQITEKSSAQASLQEATLALRTKLISMHNDFKSTEDIISIIRNDILPQANQSLKANQDSYQLGNVSFDRVIDDFLRLIRFQDSLEDNLAKLATLHAGIERVLGKTL